MSQSMVLIYILDGYSEIGAPREEKPVNFICLGHLFRSITEVIFLKRPVFLSTCDTCSE